MNEVETMSDDIEAVVSRLFYAGLVTVEETMNILGAECPMWQVTEAS